MIAQLKKLRLTLLITLSSSVLVLIGVVLLSNILDSPIDFLTRDPAAVAQTNPFIGALSNLGILIWCVATVMCLFTVVILSLSKHADEQYRLFFIFAGIMSFILMMDDLFLMHERIFPWYLKIPETFVFLAYGLFLLYILVRFRGVILETEYLLLTLALAAFAGSLIVDFIPEDQLLGIHHIFEDGFKFIGIAFWAVYFGRTTFRIIQETFQNGPASIS